MSRSATEQRDAFDAAITAIVESILRKAQETFGTGEWKHAYVDSRSSTEGGVYIEKFRIEMEDGSIIKTIKVPMEQCELLYDIWQMKDALFPEKWFGIKITVFPNGQSTTEYNLDPDCMTDPTFFDHDSK